MAHRKSWAPRGVKGALGSSPTKRKSRSARAGKHIEAWPSAKRAMAQANDPSRKDIITWDSVDEMLAAWKKY